ASVNSSLEAAKDQAELIGSGAIEAQTATEIAAMIAEVNSSLAEAQQQAELIGNGAIEAQTATEIAMIIASVNSSLEAAKDQAELIGEEAIKIAKQSEIILTSEKIAKCHEEPKAMCGNIYCQENQACYHLSKEAFGKEYICVSTLPGECNYIINYTNKVTNKNAKTLPVYKSTNNETSCLNDFFNTSQKLENDPYFYIKTTYMPYNINK
ncbi:MAG: hypothetical protein ABIG60_05460, partial [Patescibacteria group bacterium]